MIESKMLTLGGCHFFWNIWSRPEWSLAKRKGATGQLYYNYEGIVY